MSKKKNFSEGVREFYHEAPRTMEDHPFYGFELDVDQQNALEAIWNPDNTIVFIDAIAGAGKTLLATGVANMLVQYGLYNQIVYIVSAYGEQKQGFLPGDITQKSEVYFEPFYQALIDCGVVPEQSIINDSMIENQKNGKGYIKCLTHTFMRGTNLKGKKVVILDECQNFALEDLKKVLTRCSDDCKIICIGHHAQCDMDKPQKSGFVRYLEHYRGHDKVAVCELTINHRGWVSSHADALMF